MKKRLAGQLIEWAQIALGLLVCAAAYNMYLIPNEIAPGGFTGIGQLVNSFTGWPVGRIALCLNVPLFLVSLKPMGLRFGVRSVVASFGLSLLIDYLPLPALTDDTLLSAVFGGVACGAGFGLILRGGATTGGSDMLGALVNRHIPVLRVSVVTFAVDALVIIASGFVFDATAAMQALISAFLMSKLFDLVLEGPNLAKAYYIISDKGEAIAGRIMREMNRGVTALSGQGMYSGEKKTVLLCVVNRMESMRLRTIVAQEDKSAFVIATNVHEALGEGFKPHV